MDRPRIRLERLREGAVVPRYMSEGAAGMDLSSALDEPLVLEPRARAAVPTGWAIEIPPGYEGQVRPRSGAALRRGLSIPNAPGTIDSDYRGELAVILINLGEEPVVIEPGMRIAQLVIAPVARAEIVEVSELAPSERGRGGFGSTGVT